MALITTKGQFKPFLIPYNDGKHNVPSSIQAISILDEALNNISAGFSGTAITYSANYGQTTSIKNTYNSGAWKTNIGGMNQADVMTEMEKAMATPKYISLQGKLHIAPITTIPPDMSDIPAWITILQADMTSIENLLQNNWVVLGWQNQTSLPEYAHADSHAAGVIKNFPVQIHDLIQNTLSGFAANYPKT